LRARNEDGLRAKLNPPAWYRYRSGMFALIYVTGFTGSWAALAIQGRPYEAAFHATGSPAIALSCVAIAVAIRLWGSSYLTADTVWSGAERADAMIVAGPFRFCRHPLYAANILLAIGLGALAPLYGMVAIVAAHLVFIRMLIGREERGLAARYPAQYARYRAVVPSLLPRLVPAPASLPPVRASIREGLRAEAFSMCIIAGIASFFFVPRYAPWVLAGAYAAGVLVQRHIEKP
jgi:protein-S-isoprenylcysteine O-methyltransferase Ste14